jgi:Spy/CpxP family protein refolding chaperone
MKNIIMLAMAMTISFAMHAQRGHGPHRNPDEAAKSLTERMKTELGLTDQQYASVHSINLEYAKKASTLRGDSSTSRDERHTRLKSLRQQKRTELKKVLTPEQQQKWADARKERKTRSQVKRGDHAAARNEHLKNTLSLSDDQSAKLGNLQTSHREMANDIRKDTKLADADKKSRLKALRDDHEAAVKNLLSNEQFTKWKEQKASRRKGLEKRQQFQK